MKKKFTTLLLLLVTTTIFAQVPTNGLVAYYPFRGNAIDFTGNGHDGLVNGAILTTDRFNHPNNAYSFDGIDDLIFIPNSADFNFVGTGFSISLWAYLVQPGSSMSCTMVSKRDGVPGNTAGFIFDITRQDAPMGSPKVKYQIAGGLNPNLYDNNLISLNCWHHLVLTFNALIQETKIYVDDTVRVISNSIPSFPANNASMFFGHDSLTYSLGYNYTFNGKLDDIGFYNRAISQLDIDTIYDSFKFAGISENSNHEVINISTFVFNNTLNINTSLETNTTKTKIEITNILGQVIYNKNYAIENNELSEKIDISNFKNGIYIIRLNSGDNFISKKIVIAR
jgi:hypothetical protein